jgi:uncharacterized protein (TIGR03435 family)
LLSQERPSFEVASVRPAPEHRGRPSFAASPRPPFARSSGRFDATATLRDLITWAFGLQFPMEGSFHELDDVFVIEAKAQAPVLLAQRGYVGPMNQMVQSLLEERFKLRVRWETRSFDVYALRRTTPDQLGRNLKRIDADCPPGYPETVNAAPAGCAVRLSMGSGRLSGVVPRIADLANFLSSMVGRRVVDDTGLSGRFELSTAFDPRSEPEASFYPAEDLSSLPSLRDALRHDLGFTLTLERRDFPVLVVEHVEQPTEN